MKAVGYYQSLAINEAASLLDLDLPVPTATGRDLLVEVKAISVNRSIPKSGAIPALKMARPKF